MGTIAYGPNERGAIVGIELTLTGNEPMDIAAYAARNASLPTRSRQVAGGGAMTSLPVLARDGKSVGSGNAPRACVRRAP